MKASYKDSMQNVVFGESEKAKIRRVILATTVPVKQRSNILHWKYMIVIAAVFFGWCWNIQKCETELGK